MNRSFSKIAACFIAVVVLSAALVPPSDAQLTPRDHAIHVGISGGANNAWIVEQYNYGLGDLDAEVTIRPSFGLQVGYQFFEGIGFFDGTGIRTGLMYTQMGQEYEQLQGDNYRRLTYLQLPLLAHFRIGAVDRGVYLQSGLQVGLLQRAEVAVLGETEPVILGEPRTGDDLFRSTDWNWLLEAGPYFAIGERAYVNIGIRSVLSLQDINAPGVRFEAPDQPYSPSHNIAIGLHFSLYYFLPLGV